MKNVIIIHGVCSKQEYYGEECKPIAQKYWFPWIKKQLLAKGIFTQIPEMPKPYMPVYEEWQMKFKGLDINKETVLIGHSAGAGFLLRWLSENKTIVKKLILVAPWLDPHKTEIDKFFDFEIDKEIVDRIEDKIDMFVSSDDDKDILDSVEVIKKSLPEIKIHEYTNKGHFTFNDMKSNEFSELLELIVD